MDSRAALRANAVPDSRWQSMGKVLGVTVLVGEGDRGRGTVAVAAVHDHWGYVHAVSDVLAGAASLYGVFVFHGETLRVGIVVKMQLMVFD